LKGFAFKVVTVSKQAEKDTFGASDPIMMILAELAGFPVTQLRLEVRMHRTLSLFAGLYINVGALLPLLMPLTFHWYIGIAPPFMAVAIKVTADPGQNGFEDAAIVIPAGRLAFTTMVTGFDNAGFPDVHVSEDNSEQATTSPFKGV